MATNQKHSDCHVGGGKSELLQDYLVQQQFQTAKRTYQQPIKIKMTSNNYSRNNFNDSQDETSQHNNEEDQPSNFINHAISQVQKKILAFFYIYATLVVSLYLTYAIYCYHQQGMWRKQAGMSTEPPSDHFSLVPDQSGTAAALRSPSSQLVEQLELKLESKIHLLERYIEVIALDLEETKARLKEREKCACSIGCSFNGTKYSDNQVWQEKCDTCVCQSGKISCAPRKCPQLQNCDDAVQLPGTCCPTCMKKCKLNKSLVGHGHTFRPTDSTGKQMKQCKCHDGLIKCEPIQQRLANSQATPKLNGKDQLRMEPNKTISEYLKLIRVDAQHLDLKIEEKPATTTTTTTTTRAPVA